MGTWKEGSGETTSHTSASGEQFAELSRASEPTLTIVETVAAVTNSRPETLPPLAHSIDPEALNRLFVSSERPPETGTVAFEYADCEVRVTSHGTVSVRRSRENRR